jgi:hypothetical protein
MGNRTPQTLLCYSWGFATHELFNDSLPNHSGLFRNHYVGFILEYWCRLDDNRSHVQLLLTRRSGMASLCLRERMRGLSEDHYLEPATQQVYEMLYCFLGNELA